MAVGPCPFGHHPGVINVPANGLAPLSSRYKDDWKNWLALYTYTVHNQRSVVREIHCQIIINAFLLDFGRHERHGLIRSNGGARAQPDNNFLSAEPTYRT